MSRFAAPRLFRLVSFRLAALYALLFAVSALVLGVTVYLQARSALDRQAAARIETEATFLGGEYQEGGLPHLIALVRKRSQGAAALAYLVRNASGTTLAGDLSAPPGLSPGWHTLTTEDMGGDSNQPEHIQVFVTALGHGLLLAIGGRHEQADELEEAIGAAFVATVGPAALLGIIGGALISRAFLRRVDTIARTAEAIIGGDLTRRVPVRGTDDELDRLSLTLNRMLDRIAALMESLRQIGSDVAHDLRTPLSRLHQRLERIQTDAGLSEDSAAAIDGALAEARGLLDTFAALLLIAQVEGAGPRAGLAPVDLSALAETVADAYRPDAEASGHRLEAAIEPGLAVLGNKELLTQALANLIENGLRHTPPGSRIAIRVQRRPGGPCLTIEDNGPGVPEAELSRLTGRFYRGERSRSTAGNGLGLTLVHAVAELHGATLSLTSAQPGLRASLTFNASKLPLPEDLGRGQA